MQLPILNGVFTGQDSDYRTSYPINMIPVPKEQGISQGYLRPGYGLISYGDGPGRDSGGVNWMGTCYRVMGTEFVKVLSDGTFKEISDIAPSTQVKFDYSFDLLAVACGGNLYYYNGATLQQVTDPDLGNVIDMVWVDGYFMTTDGEFLVVTELSDPFSVNPLKYGSSEADPDPIKALLKVRNEVYALNRHTIEVFDNIVTSNLFPFQRIESAQIEKGTIGTHTCCVFMETIAFLGSGVNESPSVYLGYNSQAQKISTREIDQIILEYTTEELENVVCEAKVDSNHQHLMIHFPDQTLVYDGIASVLMKQQVWFILRSTLAPDKSTGSLYQARNHVRVYNKWLVGDPSSSRYGYLTPDTSEHYEQPVRWEFATKITYNETNGAIFHELELIGNVGRSALNDESTLWTQYTTDGRKWSMPKSIRLATVGNTEKRMVWFQQGYMRKMRVQRFFGTSDANLSISRLDVNIEGLNA